MRQQWGILHNGGNPDAATPRERRSISVCKALSAGYIITVDVFVGNDIQVTVLYKKATANYVPAAAVIRSWQALSGIIGRKARAGGLVSLSTYRRIVGPLPHQLANQTRPKLLREAAVGNIAQWGKP